MRKTELKSRASDAQLVFEALRFVALAVPPRGIKQRGGALFDFRSATVGVAGQ